MGDFPFYQSNIWTPLSQVWDVPDDITKPDTQVVARHAIHAYAFLPTGVISQDDTHRLPTLPPSQHHCVPPEELQLLCLILVKHTHPRTQRSQKKYTHDTDIFLHTNIQTCDRLTMLLSSLRASSTISLLGLCFCFRMAVEKSSPFGLPDKGHIMTLSHAGPALVALISSCDTELYLDSLWFSA